MYNTYAPPPPIPLATTDGVPAGSACTLYPDGEKPRYEYELNYLKVHVGTNFLNISGTAYDVASVSIHVNHLTGNDIALVHLKTPLKYSTLDDGEISNNLQEIELSVYPREKCKWERDVKNTQFCTLTIEEGKVACNLNTKIIIATICNSKQFIVIYNFNILLLIIASLFQREYYDAGSPLVANGAQIGIVSYFFPCTWGYPNVHTRVSSFITWIIANLKN
ncbi:Chymotrypsin-1 [Temnothorax longispinosus]|uniref:Chymotrypsin-1 n=1 Tax=Temnothorax longispinosus TaxID=300112 RepID=A0A4S2KTA0_9HYME|nr:Chymotrypsin-1 [Temnothorax longispinosus]